MLSLVTVVVARSGLLYARWFIKMLIRDSIFLVMDLSNNQLRLKAK